jgi:hypothetical protein
MKEDGHFIDDPLMVVGVIPDFSNLGLQPIHIPITLQEIIGDNPYWIKYLSKDWEGDTLRANIKFAVSKLAIKNAKFDLNGFVSTKFVISLKHIMNKHGWSELHLTPNFSATIDSISDKKITLFHFHIEYEKQ